VFEMSPIALLLSVIGLISFFWTLNNDQYDDLKGSANRILFDEDKSSK
jgi:cbb3-type cytochrome oxidase maturation protein